MMDKRTILLVLLLTGCATPITILENKETGQIARCGGERGGSIAGGMIGYSLQEKDARKCVSDYMGHGFSIIQSAH